MKLSGNGRPPGAEDAQALLLDAATALLSFRTPLTLLADLYARLADCTGFEIYAHFDQQRSHAAISRGLGEDERTVIGGVLGSSALSADFADGVAEPSLDAALRSAGLKQYVLHPLFDEHGRIGTLLLATRERDDLGAQVLDLVHRFGCLVNAALVRSRREDVLQGMAADYHRFIRSIDEGVCAIEMIYGEGGRPIDYRFVEVNPAFERQTGLRDPVGRTVREMLPDLEDAWLEIYDAVVRSGEPRRLVKHVHALNRTFDVYAMRIGTPEAPRVGVVFRDVTERERRERSLAFLAEINADFADLVDAREIMQTAGRKIGEHLGLFRLALAEIDENQEALRIFYEWCRDAEIMSGLGVHRAFDFMEEEMVQAVREGHPIAVADVATDRRTARLAQSYTAWGIRALMQATHHSGFILLAAKDTPYAWRRDEIELMDELSTRLWLRLERAWAEQTLRTISDTAPVVLWMSDADGSVTFVNRCWSVLTGQPEAAALGRGWLRAIHVDDRERVDRFVTGALGREQAFVLDYRLRSPDGSHRWVVDAGTPRYDREGRWVGYVGSVTDVHDRKMAEERLRELDRRKDDFMAVLSHELRNPLSPIKNGLHILDEVDPDSDTARRTRRIIKRQVDQLTRLVDDLLDVNRVARGKIELRRERLDLGALVRDTIDDHRALFDTKGVSLSSRLPNGPIYVDGDAHRLKQAVGNLLQNAARFTDRGQATSVELLDVEGQAFVRVADEGVGMEPETVAGLFEPFMQADDSLARSSGGLGLGLALVRGIVELHGGSVTAHSEGLGHGSVFEVRLPLAAATATRSTPARGRAAGPRPLSILIIEDAIDVAETMQMLLELEGHTVAIAHDGMEGLETARATRPDVVLCDLGLPRIDGYAVARALASDPELASIYRVAISGYALPEDIERSKAAGFQAHIAKPASLARLHSVLTNVPTPPQQ
jgi:PAS domain S-box-containing protein